MLIKKLCDFDSVIYWFFNHFFRHIFIFLFLNDSYMCKYYRYNCMCHSKEQIASTMSYRLSSFFDTKLKKTIWSERTLLSHSFTISFIVHRVRMCWHAETRAQREWEGMEIDSGKKEQRLPCDIYRSALSFLYRLHLFSLSLSLSRSLSLQLGKNFFC